MDALEGVVDMDLILFPSAIHDSGRFGGDGDVVVPV